MQLAREIRRLETCLIIVLLWGLESPTLWTIFYSVRTLCLDRKGTFSYSSRVSPTPYLGAYVLFEWPFEGLFFINGFNGNWNTGSINMTVNINFSISFTLVLVFYWVQSTELSNLKKFLAPPLPPWEASGINKRSIQWYNTVYSTLYNTTLYKSIPLFRPLSEFTSNKRFIGKLTSIHFWNNNKTIGFLTISGRYKLNIKLLEYEFALTIWSAIWRQPP